MQEIPNNLDLFAFQANRILPRHKLLKLIDKETVKLVLKYGDVIQIKEGQILYRENDPASQRCYIILMGKLALRSKLGKYGERISSVEGGDTLGEEGLFERDDVLRRETIIAKCDCFVLELQKDRF